MSILRPLFVLCLTLFIVHPASAEPVDNGLDFNRLIISSGAFTGLPSGSLVAVAVALERGTRALKLDVTLSLDDQVMVLPDPRLNELTNVAQIYPDRARENGAYLSLDFTRDEINNLVYRSSGTAGYGGGSAVFTPQFPVVSLDQVLGYIDTIRPGPGPADKPIIICELRKGWLHRRDGKDLAGPVYDLLESFGAQTQMQLFIASYDPEELQQLAEKQTVSGRGTDIGFIQLIGTNDDGEVKNLDFGTYQAFNYDLLLTNFGLKATTTYAAAIGLQPAAIFNDSAEIVHPAYIENARMLGSDLILYGEPPSMPFSESPQTSPAATLDRLFTTIGFDAVLTDDAMLINGSKEPAAKPIDNAAGSSRGIDQLIRQIETGMSDNTPADPQLQTERRGTGDSSF